MARMEGMGMGGGGRRLHAVCFSHPSAELLHRSRAARHPAPPSLLLCLLLIALTCCATAHTPSPKIASTLPRLVRTHRPPSASVASSYDAFPSLSSSLSSLTPASFLSHSERVWVAHSDLANLTRLPLLHSVTVPLSINVLTLGLDGSGERAVNLTAEQLPSWLTHLSHVITQTFVEADLSLSTPFLSSPTSHRPHSLPRAAHISYALSFRVISVAPSVLQVIEQTLATSYRTTSVTSPPDTSHTTPSPDDPLADYQLDPSLVTGLLDSLLTHLQLHLSPTLVVLNPSRRWLSPSPSPPPSSSSSSPSSPSPRRYGYRTGLSNGEIDQLIEPPSQAMHELVQSLRDHPDIQWRGLTGEEGNTAGDGVASKGEAARREAVKRRAENVTMRPVDLVDFTAGSEQWAQARLRPPVDVQPSPLPLSAHLTRVAAEAPLSLISYLHDAYVQEDCLTEAFPSSTLPLLMLDLSAGPFSWGPTIGGEGVKTERTYPSIAIFADVDEDAAALDDYRRPEVDSESVKAEKLLVEGRLMQAECDDPLMREGEQCQSLRETWQALSAMEREFKRRELRQVKQDREKGKQKEEGDRGEKLVDVPLTHRNALSYFRSDDNEEAGQLQHDEHTEANHFLSHLSSTLSIALHHLVTPSLAHPAARQRYAATVSFNLYVLTDHDKYDPLHGHLLARLKHGCEQVRMSGQTFDFQVHRMRVSDEPTLAMAYTNAMRSAVVPTLMHDGHFSAIKRLYLDTSVLLHELLHFTPSRAPPTSSTGLYSQRSLSIFLFSMDFPLPVFLDKTHTARAFPEHEAIIATQSSYHLYESPVSCNHAPVYSNLNYPFHSIMTQIVRLLSSTLPHHLAHSTPHSPSSQWAVSVGTSVLTPLSSGHRFSPLEVQAMHRAYLVLHLTEATHRINVAILRLQDTPLSASSASLQGSARWRRLLAACVKEHQHLMEYVELLTVLMEGGKVEVAVDLLNTITALVAQFEGKVSKLIGMVENAECEDVGRVEGMLGGEVLERRRLGLGRWRWTAYLLTILACLLILTYRAVQWQLKPKSS